MSSNVKTEPGDGASHRSPPGGQSRPRPVGGDDDDAAQLADLRSMLIGEELDELADIRERFERERLAGSVGAVLPEAVSSRAKPDGALATALTPAVETAMRESVRRDPSVLVDALFPVMGPAIRKAVAAAIGEMVQALNRSLEHSFSIRGLTWRMEAARTGRSFAEVVLLHSLVFRVEQVFLIHTETGLLLQHVVAPGLDSPDGDLVSGMLTAIQDFVRDSLGAAHDEALDAVRVGALTIWIERGPRATLAGVLRGEAPAELRRTFQDVITKIHAQYGDALATFDGDSAPFEECRPILEECFQARYAEEESNGPSRALVAVAAVLLLAIVATAATMLWHRHTWNGYIATLETKPGVVVTQERIGWRRYEIAGLRDPLAEDPNALLATAGIDRDDVVARWEPYASYAPELAAARARSVLAPPPTVALAAENGALRAEGLAPHAWIETARRIALVIPGVTSFDATKLRDLDEINARLEATLIRFESNATDLSAGQDAAVGRLAGELRELQAAPEWRAAAPRFEIVGHTDSSGSEETNARLSEGRAARVIDLLRDAGVDVSGFGYRGVATSEPVRAETTAEDAAFNRSVTLRVVAERQQ